MTSRRFTEKPRPSAASTRLAISRRRERINVLSTFLTTPQSDRENIPRHCKRIDCSYDTSVQSSQVLRKCAMHASVRTRIFATPHGPPNPPKLPTIFPLPQAEALRPPTTSQWEPKLQRRPMVESICYGWPWRMLRADSVRPQGSDQAAKVFRDALRANIRAATNNTPGRNTCRDTL